MKSDSCDERDWPYCHLVPGLSLTLDKLQDASLQPLWFHHWVSEVASGSSAKRPQHKRQVHTPFMCQPHGAALKLTALGMHGISVCCYQLTPVAH